MSTQSQSTTEPRPSSTESQWEHIGECAGCANHDHDLVHDLSRRFDALWRYGQFVANAEGQTAISQGDRAGYAARSMEAGHQQGSQRL